MEKREYYVEFADETPASYGRGTTPGICYLAYSQRGYYLTPHRQGFQYFASEEDAKEACLHLIWNSGGLKGPFSAVTVRKGESTVCHVTKFRALPDGKECPTPATLAAARKQLAAAPNRPTDFASHEKEHENMKLPEMEQSLIAEFKARCELGFKQYGPVYLAKRNWGKEMKEEALDGLFYALMASKTVEKYGAFIQALEEASDDDLSMDACSPDPLKQATYLVKKYAADLGAMEKELWWTSDKVTAAEVREELAQKEAAELRKALEDERKDADRYFVESDELGRVLKEVTLERDYYKDSAQCALESLADATKEKDRLRNELNQLRASAILNALLGGRPR